MTWYAGSPDNPYKHTPAQDASASCA